MKTLIIPLLLALILIQLPFGSPPQEEKQEAETSPVKGWWLVTYATVPPTQYSKTKGILKAESVGARSSLFKEAAEKEKDYPVLSWRWKVSNVVRSAIETRKDRYDAAAKVIVVFGTEKCFRFLTKQPEGIRMEYIWASRLPRGRIFDHPGEKDCKIFVLESGEGLAGQWASETRDIRKDFKTAFRTDPPSVWAIGIETDTDHSNEMVTAWYSEPTFRKK